MDPLAKKGNNGIVPPTVEPASVVEAAPVEEELVEIEALYTAPMPEPMHTGLRFFRPKSEALGYVNRGMAKLVTPAEAPGPPPPVIPPFGASLATGEPTILSAFPERVVEP